MPGHHDDKPHAAGGAKHAKHDKKPPGKGAKEKEIAAALTAATVALAGAAVSYPSLDAAADGVAAIYAKMFDLVTGSARIAV